MPRLPPRLLRRAYRISPLLAYLLPATRTLDLARTELRWLRSELPPTALPAACRLRGGHYYPLQYILGTQPFGPLTLHCRRGVLIPRPETEELASNLAHLLNKHATSPHQWPRPIRIADLCTGTGCIALLLASKLKAETEILGVDISTHALKLAQENLIVNAGALRGTAEVRFVKADLFDEWKWGAPDILVANPPYISEEGFMRQTQRSVRWWEPKEALVPKGGEDAFYKRILEIAEDAQGVRLVVCEVGEWEQAERVKKYWERKGWKVGIWKDFRGEERTVVGWKEQEDSWIRTGP